MDVSTYGIMEIRALYEQNEITARELVFEYIKRISHIDQPEGGCNAVAEINPDVVYIATALDELNKKGEKKGPLHGIPILLKDSICTMDRMVTSDGSIIFDNNYANVESTFVKRLRETGAIIMGKANLTEFGNYISDEGMPNGYSSRGGRVYNPHNKSADVSGSSSGSCAAVATGLCPVAIGTEASGSIMAPARKNGVVGIKPTIGLVSNYGVIPLTTTLDTAGPIARTVEDAAILLSYMAGWDEHNPQTQVAANESFVNFQEFIGAPVKGMRVGINRIYEDRVSPEEMEAFNNMCHILESLGVTLVDGIEYDAGKTEIRYIMKHEVKKATNAFLARFAPHSDIKTLNDLIIANHKNRDTALKYGQGLFAQADNYSSGKGLDKEYIDAMVCREQAIKDLDAIFDNQNIDAMIYPSYPSVPPFAGFPSITIPIGRCSKDILSKVHGNPPAADGRPQYPWIDNNLPIGSYWLAKRFHEHALIKLTSAVEKALNLDIRPHI